MKKITSLILALSVTMGVNALAFEAVYDNGRASISPDRGGDILWSAYDEDGRLIMSEYIKAPDEKYSASLAEGDNIRYRAGYVETGEFFDVAVRQPALSQTAEPTEAPASKYPSIYKKERDAVYTFGVVKKVSSVLNDGDDAYQLDMLLRGEEVSYTIPSDVKIAAASDYYTGFTGSDAGVLKEGDMIYIDRSVSGKIRALALIYRPLNANIVTSGESFGENFERLISSGGRVYDAPSSEPGSVISYKTGKGSGRYQNAFGVIVDKYSLGFTLADQSGTETIDISVEDDTIVYVCDMSSKCQVSIGSVGSIVKSGIPSSAYDDKDNITYTDDYIYNYAFARVVGGTAAEVVVFTGYNE